jgi:transposase
LRPLVPDSAATVHLRSAVRARKDLLTHRVALANQLRAHLRFFHPGPVGLFADLDAVTSLRFLSRFGCQDDTDWLTPSRLATWLRSVGYTGRKNPTALHAHLRAAAPRATGPASAAAAQVTGAFVAALTAIVTQIHTLDRHITALLAEHADAHIFLSLPRAQALRAARLLAEIGDCRGRFPTPESLASLAGTTPSTRQSGKMKTTSFRWSADKQLRDAVCDFAADSRHANPWAGRRPLRPGPGPRTPPPPRRPDRRAGLAARHLALLARPPALRPRPSPRPPGSPPPAHPRGGGDRSLTPGDSLKRGRVQGSARPPEGAGPPGPVL